MPATESDFIIVNDRLEGGREVLRSSELLGFAGEGQESGENPKTLDLGDYPTRECLKTNSGSFF